MYRALLLVALLACKKEQPAGLPPSSDWQAGDPGKAAPADPHGGATDPADPHAGVRGDPHNGMDPKTGGDPHAGVDMHGGPHGGSADQVPNTMPTKTAPKTLEKTADGRSVLGPFTFVAPKEWAEQAITSNMRAAHYVLSAKPNEEAELIVYYFGEGGAGGVEANLDRWLGQITQTNGKPSKDVAKIEKTKFAGQDATVVSVSGHLSAPAMPGGPAGVDNPDAMLLAAIVGSPSGPYYFKTTGSKKTVEANAAKFRAMLASMKLK